VDVDAGVIARRPYAWQVDRCSLPWSNMRVCDVTMMTMAMMKTVVVVAAMHSVVSK